MIAPGVPDVQSMRTALEMGYAVHSDGIWWPVYKWEHFMLEDFNNSVWPEYIKSQWKRLGVEHYISADDKRTKEIAIC